VLFGSYMNQQRTQSPTTSEARRTLPEPLKIEDWRKQTLDLGLISQGEILARIFWDGLGAATFAKTALDKIPAPVMAEVEDILTGESRYAAPSWALEDVGALKANRSPLDPYNEYPGKWSYQGRIASIIACSVDSDLTWRVLVIIEDAYGKLLGPRFEPPRKALLHSAVSVSSASDFVGLHLTIKLPPNSHPPEDTLALTSCVAVLLMAPTLELEAINNVLKPGCGKLYDWTKTLHGQVINEDSPPPDIAGKVDGPSRSAHLVINAIDRVGPSFLVNYHQLYRVFGASVPLGPFEQPSRRLLSSIASESMGNLESGAVELPNEALRQPLKTSDLAALSVLAHTPACAALRKQGLSRLSDSDTVAIKEAYLEALIDSDETAEGCRNAACTLVLSIKRGEVSMVPTSAEQLRRTASEERLLFSLHVKVDGTTNPTELIRKGLRDLNKESSAVADHSGSFLFCYGLILSAEEFAEQVKALTSTTPTDSVFYSFLISSVKTALRVAAPFADHKSPDIEWEWAKVKFDKQPEQTTQRVGLLVKHSRGASLFELIRNKDTGHIYFNSTAERGGIVHRQTIPFKSGAKYSG
jgi:hypothetical protein